MKLKVVYYLIILLGGVVSASYGGLLTSVTSIPENAQAGATTIYTFNFTTDTGGIPADGKIVITFPGTFPDIFDVTGASIAQTTNSLTMDGGLTASGATGVITLTRDGTGAAVTGGDAVGVMVAVINNHQTSGDYTVDIETQLGDGTQIDTGTSSTFTIIHNTLAAFQFDPIIDQTAGLNFGITITAQDQYGNTVETFTGTASLSDFTGTMTPVTTTNFLSGTWTGSVQITQAVSNNEITVTAQNKSGTSNQFNVQAGGADHFTFENISSPQTAGQTFSITVVARDVNENIATSFSSTANLSDNTGTIVPSATTGFTNGEWTGNVTITRAHDDVEITATQGGINGTSDKFNVQADDVDHFSINNISTQAAGESFVINITALDAYDNIAEQFAGKVNQTAGQSFSITIRAEDSANNPVTSFTGTGILSDLTGTLNPTITGNFIGGSWTGNVSITKTHSTNSITITSGDKAGTSDDFAVNPAALDEFKFSNIISPQEAGGAFGITIVAKDQFDNQVTNFTGVANLSDNTTTISPGTTTNFVNGSWTGNVTIISTAMDNVIIANGSGKSGESNKFNVIASSLDHFVLTPISTQAAGEPFMITITAQDVFGNVATQYSGKVDISDETSTISPTESENFSNGQWIGSVAITQVKSADEITVINQGGSETGNSGNFDVISSDVDHFVISTIGTQTAGQSFSITIRAEDASNNLVTTFTGTATLSDLTTTLSPITTGSFSSGQWTGNVTITKSKTGNTITVKSSGKSVTSNAFTVSPAVLDHFSISDISSPQTAGQPFSVTVVAEDLYDNQVSSFVGVVTISENTSTISPTVSGNFVAGSWTDNVSITQTVVDNIIEVNGSGKTGQSNKFNVNSSSLHHFVLNNLATQAAGEPFLVEATAQDVYDNTATQFTGKINISDNTGTISPTESGNFSNGFWAGIMVITQTTANNIISVENQAGNENGVSNSFAVISGIVDKFIISAIGIQQAGQAFSVTIRAEDKEDNLVTDFTGTATLSDYSETITPLTTTNFSAGTWTGDVTITKSYTGNILKVTSSGRESNSNPFNVTPAGLDHFTFDEITSSKVAGTQFQITIYAEDFYKNLITSFNTYVNLSDETGTIIPATTPNFANGSWTGNVEITKSQANIKITAERDGKTGETNFFNVNPGALTSFDVATIYTQAAGKPFLIKVTALDANSNVATQFSGTVDISDLTNTISPVISNNFEDGKWAGNVTISQGMQDNRITVKNSGDAQTGNSNNFQVTSGVLDHFVFEMISSPQTAGVPFNITITAQDADSNTVTSFSDIATLSDGTGTIEPTNTGSFVNGIWNGEVTIIEYSNNNKIAITKEGKAGESNSFTVSNNSLDHFVIEDIVSPQIAGTPFAISITAKDEYENDVLNYSSLPNLSDSTDTIFPTQTDLFTNGKWTGNVKITKSQNDVRITVEDNGKTGRSNSFNVNPGSLTSFDVAAIDSQAAGKPFMIKVTALDSHSNVATQFLGTVDISDLTNTITPEISNNFEEGKWTGNVTISQGRQDNIITVTKSGGSETGQSNTFNVTAGVIDHFVLDMISSPQTAGVPFSITITAEDADSNTVTKFTDIATLSDETGTIDPTNTGNFVNGIWSGEVTITKYSNNNKITITKEGKAGESNSFAVLNNSLDHFIIEDISSPQKAGIPFNVSITAKDEYNNDVLNYSSLPNLFDNTNTISPPQTGLFLDGIWSGNVKITKSQNDVRIAVEDNGKTGQSKAFNVIPGPLDSLKIMSEAGGLGYEIDSLSLSIDDKITLYAAGFDEHGNYSHDVRATWGVTGTIDPPLPIVGEYVVFDPETPRTVGKIYADTIGVMADSTGLIDAGTPVYVKIQNAQGEEGVEIFNHTMTADENLLLYSEAYDIGGANVGEESVQWLSTGDLAPAINTSGTFINFSPTTAPTVGKITANHLSLMDDSTGVFTVLPGVPVGDIILTATPPVITANGLSISVISSGVIHDADGNIIAENTQFTVRAALGTITSPDVNATLPGIQIQSDAEGKIQFNFQASTIGGIARITVNSAEGSAYGETTVFLSSLNIVSVSSPKQAVSLGQNNVRVNMVVENKGSSTVTNLSAGLIFTGPAPANENRNGDFPDVERIDTVLDIPGGSQRTLSFNVDVRENAATDAVAIDGWISGEIAGETVADTSADTTWEWAVQTPAELKITKIHSLNPEVSQGMTELSVAMYVINNGEASASVGLDTLKFWSVDQTKDVTGEYVIIPSAMNPTLIQGGERKQFDFSVSVGVAATLGQTTVNGLVTGFDVNSEELLTDNTADTTYSWLVKEKSIVGIKGFFSTVDRVTSGQTKPWELKMIMENNGGTSVTLDSTKLLFSLMGDDVTSEYEIIKPANFKNSNNITLSANSVDTLIYRINETGISIGDITVRGTVYLKELKTNNPIIDESITGIKILAPAEIKIMSLTLSQNSVTINQHQDWTIKVAVKNEGGTNIKINASPSKTKIGFTNGAGFDVNPPIALAGGGLILESGSLDTLTFVVDKTGSDTGNCFISAQVTGAQTTDNVEKAANFSDTTHVILEEPALLRILSVISQAPNDTLVNIEQVFPIHVILENRGQDEVEQATVELRSSGNSILDSLSFNFTNIRQDSTIEQIFSVTADNNSVLSEVFTANIKNAKAQNTSESLGILIEQSPDSTETITIQEPATFQITNIISPDSVFASQANPWQIKVVLANIGEAGAKITPPSDDDISLKINDELQHDYIIEAPDNLSNGGLVLQGGNVDTLIYEVTSTGAKSGLVNVSVSLQANDKNNLQIFTDHQSKVIKVVAIASVQLYRTAPICPNIVGEKGFVNSGQSFKIRVWIQNLARKIVTNVNIRLTTDGNSEIDPPEQMIGSIGYQQTVFRDFDIVADLNEVNENEIFTSEIISAFIDGEPASTVIGDNRADIAVQDSAKLRVEAWVDNSVFKTGQTFKMKAKVTNVDDFPAQVDGSGQLILNVPEEYRIIVGDDTLKNNNVIVFEPEETYSWTILTPDFKSGPDTLGVSILFTPKDKNINEVAQVIQQSDIVVVSTVETAIDLFIVSPEGAQDNILSTRQEFIVQTNVFYSETYDSVRASLVLPPGSPNYSFVTPADWMQSIHTRHDSVRWVLRAPNEADENYRNIAMTMSYDIKGELTTRDTTITIDVKTVKRAELELIGNISSPADAMDGFVSVNQDFELQAKLENHGDAHLDSTYQIKLILPSGYSTTDDSIKYVSGTDLVNWQIKAPSTPRPESYIEIKVPINMGPNDENTGQEAYFLQRSKYIKISTGEKTVTVTQLEANTSNIVVNGQNNISLMSLTIKNPPGDANSSNINFEGLKITAKDKDGNDMQNPDLAISRISACNYNDNDIIYGSVTDFSNGSLMTINFAQPIVIYPDSVEFKRLFS